MDLWTADNLKNHAVTVVGLGRSGLAAARFCRAAGARVTVSEAGAVDHFIAGSEALERAGVSLEFGPHREAAFTRADLIVLSPGVPHTIAPLEAARQRGVPVMGEMELAARFVREPIAAITGTNGKTTTTELLGAMLAASGLGVFVGGNIGRPLIEYVEAATPVDWLVVEVSSFQLDTMTTFRPRIACLLNISDDHLDRYPDAAAYAASKWRLFGNQTDEDTAILNAAVVDTYGPPDPLPAGRVLYFNGAPEGHTAAAVLSGSRLRLDPGPGSRCVELAWPSLPLVGRHNEENIEAAALAALTAGATPAGIRQAVADFEGLPHRVRFVREVDGVRYYDDSKATNVDAVARALDSFAQPVVLIMGGRDKGGSYQALEARLRQKVCQLIVMGEAADIIARAFRHIVPIRTAGSMGDAVRIAAETAREGQVVLLSPACSSFDWYDNYHQRGEDFCHHVQQLP